MSSISTIANSQPAQTYHIRKTPPLELLPLLILEHVSEYLNDILEVLIIIVHRISYRTLRFEERGHAGAIADRIGVPLLSACVESRQVYIERNKKILPGGLGSLIRHNADLTWAPIPHRDPPLLRSHQLLPALK